MNIVNHFWSSVYTIAKKELLQQFISLGSYVVLLAYILGTGLPLLNYFLQNNEVASLREYFGFIPLLLMIIIPILTMNVWAEEEKKGSIWILYSLPFTLKALVWGKFLGAWLFMMFTLAFSLPAIIFIVSFGNFDLGLLGNEILGLLLYATLALSLGIFFSALSRHPIAAFLLTLSTLFFIVVLVDIIFYNWPEISRWLNLDFIDFNKRFASFQRGILDTKDVAFFAIGSLLFVYLTEKLLYFRKW